MCPISEYRCKEILTKIIPSRLVRESVISSSLTIELLGYSAITYFKFHRLKGVVKLSQTS